MLIWSKYLIVQIPFKDVSFSLKFFNQSLLSNNLSVETLIVNVNKVKKCAIMLSQTVENKIYSTLQFRITPESRFYHIPHHSGRAYCSHNSQIWWLLDLNYRLLIEHCKASWQKLALYSVMCHGNLLSKHIMSNSALMDTLGHATVRLPSRLRWNCEQHRSI